MLVILTSMLLVLGGYVVQPVIDSGFFENGPYEYYKEYDTLAECQIATHGTGDICVGEQPSKQFIRADNVNTDTTFQEKLDWVDCDYFAGCYWGTWKGE